MLKYLISIIEHLIFILRHVGAKICHISKLNKVEPNNVMSVKNAISGRTGTRRIQVQQVVMNKKYF